MPWYIDLVMMAILCTVGTVLSVVSMKESLEAKLLTKDGYKVTIPQIRELEKKRTFNAHTFFHMSANLFTSKADIFGISLVMALLGYAIIGNIVEYFLPVENAIAGVLTMVFMLWMFYSDTRKSYKESASFIEQLSIESPEEFKQYGAFAKNPLDAQAVMKELVKLEEEWERTQTLRDDQERKVAELEKENEGNESEWLQLQRKNLAHLEDNLRHLSSNMTVKAGLLSKNLLTDNPPKGIQELIEAKQSVVQMTMEASSEEELSTEVIQERKAVPHYIEVMKAIVLNLNLPEAVRDEAQALVVAYEESEENQERQREIDNALLEIQTVKRFIA